MKSKIFKTGLPIMAFMMAIAFAFASENVTEEEIAPVLGYIIQNGVCTQVQADCDTDAVIPCTHAASGLTVFQNRSMSGTCSVPYTKR